MILYASLGEELQHYHLNIEDATLRLVATTRLPVNIQFAVVNQTQRNLYIVSSNAGSGMLGSKGDTHLLNAFMIDKPTGNLRAHGETVRLQERPIHLSLDHTGRYALIAYNQSGTLSVHNINSNGSLGERITQPKPIDAGIFTHQVTVTPDNKTVIALSRGNQAINDRPEEPGSMNIFAFNQGVLTSLFRIEMEPGIGPRHLTYHPKQPWVYVGIERGSKVYTYQIKKDGTLENLPMFKKETLMDITNEHRPRQKGGVLQISQDGKYLYVSNRADKTQREGDKAVFAGGENNIAVFAIDQQTGKPTLIQHVDTHGIEARTFNIDPTGNLFVIANQKSMWVREGGKLNLVRANFALFRVDRDGMLHFIRKYEIEDTKKWLLWMDIYPIHKGRPNI